MDDIKRCRKCDAVLVVGETWCESGLKNRNYRCRECNKKRLAEKRQIQRAWAMNMLDSKPKCIWCGLTRIQSLTFDHINDDGASHRRDLGTASGDATCRWIINNPDEARERIQILCVDCNSRKQCYGLTKEKRLAEMEQERCNPQQEQTENSSS